MRETLTVSLPGKLRRDVARAAKAQRITQSEFVRKAVLDKLWEDTFDATRRVLVPKARSMGIYTDEDVFKVIS